MADEQVTPSTETQPDAPKAQLRDKRSTPEGVVPKKAQSYVIAGLALLILMAVMFSKNHPKPASKDTPQVSTASAPDVNRVKIQELEQSLTAAQTQGQQQAATAAVATPPNPPPPGAQVQPVPPVSNPEPPRDPVADAEKTLAFKARFASNLVVPAEAAPRQPEPAAATASAAPAVDMARLLNPAAQTTEKKRAPEVNVNSAHGQPFVVFEGTTVDTVLVNRLDGEFSGPVKVMVTNPLYSQDRQHMLIPEGSFLLGDVQKVGGMGQKRLAVTFHRLLMPDGYSVDLDQFHGLDQAGETGIKDQVNNHYVQIFGASIALGVIAGAVQSTNANQGLNQSGSEAYRSGVASSLSQSGSTVLDRFINIPPTLTIREGHRIKVYITQDMLLPAYENHDMPGVM